MIRTVFLLTALFFFQNTFAQDMGQRDTLYANDRMNLALFFPAEIRQGIVGSENFIFTYNREKGQTLGLLKAIKGEASNLLVITVDGKIYSYSIAYAEKLNVFNRFVTVEERIGEEMGNGAPLEKVTDKDVVEHKDGGRPLDKAQIGIPLSKEFMARSCASLLDGVERRNHRKRKKGLSLGIKNMIYHKGSLFVQYEIRNRSGIDLDIETLEFKKVQGDGNQKASYQVMPLEPIYTHDMPKSVRHGENVRFVRVYGKTTLGDGERFLVVLREKHGSREISLNFSQ